MTDTKSKVYPGDELLFRGGLATFLREIPHNEQAKGIQGEIEVEQRGQTKRCFWNDVLILKRRGSYE